MVSRLTDSILTLEAGQAIALERHHRYTIRCLEDHLWLTQDGLAGDIVLRAGEKVTLHGHGRIVIEAGKRAKFALTTAPLFAELPLMQQTAQWLHKAGRALDGLRSQGGMHKEA